jgi:hypothetical protein
MTEVLSRDPAGLEYSQQTHLNERILHQVTEWPKAMQETVLQKICRIAYDILSVIIFPIGLIRLAAWCIQKIIARAILPAAYCQEKAADALNPHSDESWDDIVWPIIFRHGPLPSGTPFLERLPHLGEEGIFLSEFIQSMQDITPNADRDDVALLVDTLIVSLNRLPNVLLSKLILSQIDFCEPLGQDASVCRSAITNYFAHIRNFLSRMDSLETRAIFRKVLLQQPNTFPMTVTTPDGVELDGVYVRQNDDPNATTVIACNPNAVPYERYYGSVNPGYRDREGAPLNYIYFNYRGVSHSKGAPSAQGLLLDGYAFAKTVQELFGVPRKKIIVHGWSIGGPIAVFAASETQGEAPDGSDSTSCCNERSFSTLPNEIEALFETRLGCCIPTIAAYSAKWVGWDWDCMPWWRDINGYKWTVVHPDDNIIPHKASLTRAWRDENPGISLAENILEMESSAYGHTRPYYQDERNRQEYHIQQATLTSPIRA